jgi:hypothetical protein
MVFREGDIIAAQYRLCEREGCGAFGTVWRRRIPHHARVHATLGDGGAALAVAQLPVYDAQLWLAPVAGGHDVDGLR